MESKQVGLLLKVVMLSILAFDRGNCNTQDMGKVVTGVKDSESSLHRDSRSVHRSQRSATNETQTNEAVDNHNRVRRLVGASDAEKMVCTATLGTGDYNTIIGNSANRKLRKLENVT